MATAPWRVVIISALPRVAQGYAAITRACGHDPVAVIVPRRAKPGAPAIPFAQEHVSDDPEELDVLFPATKRSLARMLRAYDADLALCTGFPWLIGQDAIDATRLGIVNGHPSLLPRYRGPFPIAWAIRNGEREFGMTFHFMDAAFDTGNVLAQRPIPLDEEESEESLFAKLAAATQELLPQVFERLARGERGEAQEGGDYQTAGDLADYVHVDLSQPAADIHRQVQAWRFVPPVLPERGAILDGRRLLVTSRTEVEDAERIECGDGPLWVVSSEEL
jgi:methionyl-tRNA formyltransferase